MWDENCTESVSICAGFRWVSVRTPLKLGGSVIIQNAFLNFQLFRAPGWIRNILKLHLWNNGRQIIVISTLYLKSVAVNEQTWHVSFPGSNTFCVYPNLAVNNTLEYTKQKVRDKRIQIPVPQLLTADLLPISDWKEHGLISFYHLPRRKAKSWTARNWKLAECTCIMFTFILFQVLTHSKHAFNT